jgi:hypothetical protein
MEEYLEHRVSKEELQAIFKSDIDRSIFITDYPYFEDDKSTDFYIDFINENIVNSKYKIQEDAIELSIAIHYFKMTYLDVISSIIYSRRGWWIKLLCLDWLANFFDDVPSQTFFELNKYLTKSNNERLKIQGMLNLLLLNKNPKLVEKLLILLKKSNDHVLFYRVVNYKNIDEILTKEMIKNIVDIIRTNTGLSQSQKSELTERFSIMIS